MWEIRKMGKLHEIKAMTYSATDLGKLSGEIILEAQRKPVLIEKHGKECVAVISIQDLEFLEESRKTQKLRTAVEEGFSQIERGEYSTRTMNDIFQDVLEQRKMKSGRNIS